LLKDVHGLEEVTIDFEKLRRDKSIALPRADFLALHCAMAHIFHDTKLIGEFPELSPESQATHATKTADAELRSFLVEIFSSPREFVHEGYSELQSPRSVIILK
jgi:hypothetical protein